MKSSSMMLGAFTASLMDDIDNTPVIRPVLDMSNVTSGAQTIDGLFNSARTLNAEVTTGSYFRRNAAGMHYDNGRIGGAANNTDVVSAINVLTDRFDNLSEAVEHMQIVLDTGTVAGQMTKKIDKNLGIEAGHRARGH